RLAGAPAARVVGQHRVEHGIRDLVGDLVRMALGDRLRGEQKLTRCHGRAGYLISRNASKLRVSPVPSVQARNERSGRRLSDVALGKFPPARLVKAAADG